MTTTSQHDDPHGALMSVLGLFDKDHHVTGPVTFTIDQPARIAISSPDTHVSPLADFVAALRFIGGQRGTIWDMANTLAPNLMCGAHGGGEFSINGDKLIFVKPRPDSGLGLTVEVHSQVFMALNENDLARRPLSEKLVTYGLLHHFVAQVTRNEVGRAVYYIDGMSDGSIPPVMTANSDTYYYSASAYSEIRGHAPLFDGRHTGLQWLEDVQMLVSEGVTLGLRHGWVRRVAVPIVMAYNHLKTNDKKQTAIDAVKILRQCTDSTLRYVCVAWIAKRYGLGATDLKESDLAY